MRQSKLHNLFGIVIAILSLSAIPLQSQAADTPTKSSKVTQSDKERLVLMPLRVDEDDIKLLGSMETALVEGLKLKYEVFSGERVAQKAHEIFMKESRNTAHKECDETRCMQNIAEAFQSELIATANVTKQGGGYFLALSIQNIFDNKVEFSKTLTCEGCNAFKVVDKLKILSAVVASNTNDTTNEETQADRKLKAEQLKKEQREFEEKLRNADATERQRLLDAKAADDKRLAELKAFAEARRKNIQTQPTTFPTLEQAQLEINKLNEKIAAIEASYDKELADTRKQVKQRYSDKLDALDNEQRNEFESKDEFKANQEIKRIELKTQRDAELTRLNVSTVAETETAPFKARIKALTEHEYIVDSVGIEAELGSYDSDEHQFTVKLRSKNSILKLKLNGTIPLQGAAAKAYKMQWQTGLVRPEAKARFNGELVEVALVNDAENNRFVEYQSMFISSETLKTLFQTGRVFKDCSDCPEMVVVPAGSFNMGGNGQYDGQPIHKVTFSQPFAIGKTEVTQGQWIALMGNNPSHFINCGDNCPVENISWNDANEYIKKLNKRIGKQYRLPSEAEWEYACRAGGQGEYCGESIVYSDFTRSVAQGKANAWGLFEMSGSVWEWVEDSFHDDYNSAPIDGTAWKGLPWGNGKLKIIRGGSYREPQYGAASRLWQNPDETSGYHFGLGFRIATSLLIPGRN